MDVTHWFDYKIIPDKRKYIANVIGALMRQASNGEPLPELPPILFREDPEIINLDDDMEDENGNKADENIFRVDENMIPADEDVVEVVEDEEKVCENLDKFDENANKISQDIRVVENLNNDTIIIDNQLDSVSSKEPEIGFGSCSKSVVYTEDDNDGAMEVDPLEDFNKSQSEIDAARNLQSSFPEIDLYHVKAGSSQN